MIFNEIYGCYYQSVSAILALAVEGNLSESDMERICRRSAFGESFIEIIPALKKEKWPLLREDLSTPIENKPGIVLTELQLRWLKAISLDPRIQLFDVEVKFLENITPLFTQEDFVEYDAFDDGDPYGDPSYIQNFRILLRAIKEKRALLINYSSGKGNDRNIKCMPYKLEYSAKDNKFRVLIAGCRYADMINVARINRCYEIDGWESLVPKRKKKLKSLRMELIDQRQALERALLHFAHFQKEVENIDDVRYSVKILYDEEDETELVIRVLSFGPFVVVKEPDAFVALIKERLKMQKSCELR
jgi:hypothetical protein